MAQLDADRHRAADVMRPMPATRSQDPRASHWAQGEHQRRILEHDRDFVVTSVDPTMGSSVAHHELTP